MQIASGISAASLEAVATWNVERGLALLRQERHVKNHERAIVMQQDAGRHLRNADKCRREAWLLEHKRQPRRR